MNAVTLKSKKAREDFMGQHIKSDGGYFVTVHEGETALLWFKQFKNWRDDGSDWYLEAPCYLRRIKIDHHDDEVYYPSIGYVLKDDGYAYEVDAPQVAPFLPEAVEMEYIGESQEVAVDWLLENTYASHQWRN